MKEYEICNPSDPYTMKAPTLLLAAAAIIVLSRGQYPLVLDGKTVVPFFAFGGLDEWWAERSPDRSLGEFFEDEKAAIADVLQSVAMPEGHERSSLNDIGGAAASLSKALREQIAKASA